MVTSTKALSWVYSYFSILVYQDFYINILCVQATVVNCAVEGLQADSRVEGPLPFHVPGISHHLSILPPWGRSVMNMEGGGDTHACWTWGASSVDKSTRLLQFSSKPRHCQPRSFPFISGDPLSEPSEGTQGCDKGAEYGSP